MYTKAILPVIAACLVLTACISSDHAELGGRDFQRIGRIERAIDEADRRIEHAQELSAGITDTVQRVKLLFTEYSSAVAQLRSELEIIRAEIEQSKKDHSGGYADTAGSSGD